MVQMRKNEDEDARQEEEEDKDEDEKERESERNNEFQRAIQVYLEGTMRIEGQGLEGEDEDGRAMWMLVCIEGNNLSSYKNK